MVLLRRQTCISFDTIDVVVLDGPLFTQGNISGSEKALAAKQALGLSLERPLLETIGDEGRVAMVRERDGEWELVIPHALLPRLNYTEQTVARFLRHPTQPVTHQWCTTEDDNDVWRRYQDGALVSAVPDLSTSWVERRIEAQQVQQVAV